ncbi:DUF1289 domain-containing protein, partial [Stenotrophomonas sp. SrG]|uniref:DUF1289 domain-containing protein n=1 Tax=Stenotrophomonas sp. SrG TaxID=3414430 RepID=UPI003CEB0F71
MPLPGTRAPGWPRPCSGRCALDRAGRGGGCLRTGDAITRWSTRTRPDQEHVMRPVRPLRERLRPARG